MMHVPNLGVVEKKVFGALLILSDSNQVTSANNAQIAHTMGYKKGGGAITFALKSLEMSNRILCVTKGTYKVYL
jgi:hypothetical protein